MPSRFARLGFIFLTIALPTMAQGIASTGAISAPRVAPSGKPFPVSLVDVAASTGLITRFTYGNELKKKYIVEANGSGVAFIDYNNDGWLDVFLVNGSRFEKTAGPVPTNHLYRNESGKRFTDVTAKAGLEKSGWGNGVCAGDIDNDGHLDLYVTYWGGNVLYRNQGNGTFADITARAKAGGDSSWTTGCTFIDYDRDGHLDLFFVSYIDFQLDKAPLPGQFPYCTWMGAPVFCGPRGMPTGKATLLRNRGDGTFDDVSEKSGIRAASGFYAFTTIATDLDGDGWPDIYVACDSSPSLLFRNQRNGTFREVGIESGLAYNEHGSEQAGMGLAVADIDGDGQLDILKTNFSGDYPNFYRNQGRGIFSDAPLKAGLAVNPSYVLWGTGFVDLDNDGVKDIFQAAGHVYPDIRQITSNETYRQKRLVYRGLGNAKFEDVSAQAGPGVAEAHSSRGAAFGDFDNDGDIDVLIMNMHEPPSLLRNDLKNDNRWIKVKLEGTKSNRAAIGAIVSVYTGDSVQTEPLLSQSSYLSVNDSRLHFGLGSAKRVDKIIVKWPSGLIEEFPSTDSNRIVPLKEGTGKAQ